jgi:hypothetical protein
VLAQSTEQSPTGWVVFFCFLSSCRALQLGVGISAQSAFKKINITLGGCFEV